MSKFEMATNLKWAARRPWFGCLAVIVYLFWSATPVAASPLPDQAGPETCSQCHPDQVRIWEASPHGQVHSSTSAIEMTCQVCHGTYIPDHPQSGLMKLQTDASCCQDCHTTTYGQWHETEHAQAGIQCVSCHMPHSQGTRLTDEDLCVSCHREKTEHWVHHEAGVHCSDCHVSLSTIRTATEVVAGIQPIAAPNHSFGPVADACIDCHRTIFHQQVDVKLGEIDPTQLAELTERAQELAYELEDTQRTNRSLRTVSVVSLGLGLGTGGVLGAIFVIVIGYIVQRSGAR